MNAKLVKENISDFLKPKSKEDILKDPIYKKINKFMTKIFSDLHKDSNDQLRIEIVKANGCLNMI